MRRVDTPEPTESDAATTVSIPSLSSAGHTDAERESTEEPETEERAEAEPAAAEPPDALTDTAEFDDELTESDADQPDAVEPATAESDTAEQNSSKQDPVESGTPEADVPEREAAEPTPAAGSETDEQEVPESESLAPRAAAGSRSPGEHRAGIGTSVWLEPEEGRSRRSVLRAVAALAIAVVSAVALGLLIVVFSNAVGGGSSKSGTTPPALTLPSGPAQAPASAVPADWVQQTQGSGIVFRAPPGWTARADSVVDYRVEPGPSGPGVSQVGIGLDTGSSDPDAAARGYATDTFAGQTGYQQQPATDVVSARGERGRQVVVDYTRSGTPVDVIIRAFPTARGVLLVVSRAAVADDQRAARLADALDASVRLP